MKVIAFAALLGLGQLGSPELPADPRIQVVDYSSNRVFTLPVASGFAAVVELGADERVESIVVGDSADWQVTASKRGDHVVVKPLPGATTTNMVVITGDRRYVFLLQPASGDAPFVLRFAYPDVRPLAIAPATAPVATFRFRGTKALQPIAMHDDGQRTSITWSPSMALPAIFVVEKDGHEAIVNGRMMGGDYVVERIAEQFVFRRGKQQVSAQRRSSGASK